MSENINHVIIDKDTGEVINEISGEYKIVKKSQSDGYKKRLWAEHDKLVDMMENGDVISFASESFHKLVTEEYSLIVKELNDTELAFLARILSHVSYKSCGVHFGNVTSFTMLELAERFSMNEKTMRKGLGGLIKKKIVAKCMVGGYGFRLVLNPWICHRGSEVNSTLMHLFGDYEIRSRNMRKWKNLHNR